MSMESLCITTCQELFHQVMDTYVQLQFGLHAFAIYDYFSNHCCSEHEINFIIITNV